MSGTQERYIQDLQAEQARELAWLQKAGESQARAIEKGATAQRRGGAARNLGLTAGGIGRAAFRYWG